MKNVEILTKLRRLTKTLAASILFIFLGVAGSAFKASGNESDDVPKKGVKDSAQTDKYGFKSLFSNDAFNATKPFITQINPQAISFVQSYIKNHGKELEKLKIWGKPYLDMYDNILDLYNLPRELKYLSVIESDLKSGAVSPAGAVGPWQIMDFEARRVGLTVNKRIDERRNYEKSTHAAAKILKGLYKQFDDWLLVIAAYNCGAGRVQKAIDRSGSRSFWALQNYLPLETRNHVKRFIGTHYLFEGNGGLTTMTAEEIAGMRSDVEMNGKQLHDKLVNDDNFTKSIEISGKYNSQIIAKNLSMDPMLFSEYNPNFDKTISTGATYKLKLPVEKMEIFNEKKQSILNESVMTLLNSYTGSVKSTNS